MCPQYHLSVKVVCLCLDPHEVFKNQVYTASKCESGVSGIKNSVLEGQMEKKCQNALKKSKEPCANFTTHPDQ